jgi:hypothetical protein
MPGRPPTMAASACQRAGHADALVRPHQHFPATAQWGVQVGPIAALRQESTIQPPKLLRVVLVPVSGCLVSSLSATTSHDTARGITTENAISVLTYGAIETGAAACCSVCPCRCPDKDEISGSTASASAGPALDPGTVAGTESPLLPLLSRARFAPMLNGARL